MPDAPSVVGDDEEGGEYQFGTVCFSCFARLPPVPEDEDRATIVCPNCGQTFLVTRARRK